MSIKSMFRRLFSRKQETTDSAPEPTTVYPRYSSSNSRTYSSAPVASDDSAAQNLMLMGMMMPGINQAAAAAAYAGTVGSNDSDSSSSGSADSGSSGGN